MMRLVVRLLFFSWTLGSAQQLCGPALDICEGLSVQLVSGECKETFFVCDDGDASTQSSCQSDLLRCSHIATDGAPVCFSDCEPSCEGKQCGEDDCGGFCGGCGDGEGCSNFECIAGLAAGSCASPLNLGNQDNETIIDTDTRLTMMTTGDTTQSIHIETPSCNTLTASPELVFKFVVPEGRTFGYDFQVYGYDTVIQLMKVKTMRLVYNTSESV